MWVIIVIILSEWNYDTSIVTLYNNLYIKITNIAHNWFFNLYSHDSGKFHTGITSGPLGYNHYSIHRYFTHVLLTGELLRCYPELIILLFKKPGVHLRLSFLWAKFHQAIQDAHTTKCAG